MTMGFSLLSHLLVEQAQRDGQLFARHLDMGYLVDELDLFGRIFVLHADSAKDEAKSSSQLCQTSVVFAIGFDGSLLVLQCQFVPFQALLKFLQC